MSILAFNSSTNSNKVLHMTKYRFYLTKRNLIFILTQERNSQYHGFTAIVSKLLETANQVILFSYYDC
jgi:hypothetical protein